MQKDKYIYRFGYDNTESELCKLESRYLFNKEEKKRLLFSQIKIEPSNSAFIKYRFDIISRSENYLELIDEIKGESICVEGFKVEYLVFDGDRTPYTKRLEKLRDIGYRIEGFPDYHNPTITYAVCYCDAVWYFGILVKNKFKWLKHNQKPCSYSNSISINIGKALVNIAAKGDKHKKLLDACCGVGTIMLEACFAGYSIAGCDINGKICKDARKNLSEFGYSADVHHLDIKEISTRYDAAIIDLPYNLFSTATNDDISHIIDSAALTTERLAIVSVTDISEVIDNAGFSVFDFCSVSKKGKKKFTRKIWICEKNAGK